jgi:membrane protease subunit HflK
MMPPQQNPAQPAQQPQQQPVPAPAQPEASAGGESARTRDLRSRDTGRERESR